MRTHRTDPSRTPGFALRPPRITHPTRSTHPTTARTARRTAHRDHGPLPHQRPMRRTDIGQHSISRRSRVPRAAAWLRLGWGRPHGMTAAGVTARSTPSEPVVRRRWRQRRGPGRAVMEPWPSCPISAALFALGVCGACRRLTSSPVHAVRGRSHPPAPCSAPVEAGPVRRMVRRTPSRRPEAVGRPLRRVPHRSATRETWPDRRPTATTRALGAPSGHARAPDVRRRPGRSHRPIPQCGRRPWNQSGPGHR